MIKHPDQPIIIDNVEIARFKCNEIVRLLLDRGPYDLNELYEMDFSDDDRNQFAQLIGYSVCGFGELPYADEERVQKANEVAEKLSKGEL